MKRVYLLLVAVLAAVAALLVAVAPAASANCTGAPNCSSGWYGATNYDAISEKDFNENIAVTWFADNHRRVYSSGSTCYPTYPYLCEAHSILKIFYRSHCNCTWVLRVTDQPGPPYGSYYYDDLTSSNPTQPHDWIVQGCSFGVCKNSPIITN
jgi:hypothetical protein